MKKNKIVLGLVAILIITALLAGCIGDKTTTPPATSPATTTPSKTTPPVTTPSTPTLSEMLGMSSKIVSIKYDMLITGPGIPAITTKVWLKKNKMRTEMTQQGATAITLIDEDAKTMYVYMPAQNLAVKMPFDLGQVPEAPTDEAESILDYNAKVVGTESIDGKVCSVVEYTSGQESVKAWIWQDKGLPIRTEVTSSAGKTTVEYKNIDFADIPDSMFELPAGVTIM